MYVYPLGVDLTASDRFTLSIVVPAFNEEAVLPEFHRRLTAVLATLPADWEVVYVNDGSGDRTLQVMNGLADSHVAVIDLSRNFGKEIAMTAGLDHARGEAVVVIDADLPELIRRHWWPSGVKGSTWSMPGAPSGMAKVC